MTSNNDKSTGRGQLVFFPGDKKWFGLKGRESNFELFVANCLIEQLTMLTRIEEHLEQIAKNTKPASKPRAKAKSRAKKK